MGDSVTCDPAGLSIDGVIFDEESISTYHIFFHCRPCSKFQALSERPSIMIVCVVHVSAYGLGGMLRVQVV